VDLLFTDLLFTIYMPADIHATDGFSIDFGSFVYMNGAKAGAKVAHFFLLAKFSSRKMQ